MSVGQERKSRNLNSHYAWVWHQTKCNGKNNGKKKKKEEEEEEESAALHNVNNCSRNVFLNQIPKERVSEHGWENKSQ